MQDSKCIRNSIIDEMCNIFNDAKNTKKDVQSLEYITNLTDKEAMQNFLEMRKKAFEKFPNGMTDDEIIEEVKKARLEIDD